jgi:hypothetical protein
MNRNHNLLVKIIAFSLISILSVLAILINTKINSTQAKTDLTTTVVKLAQTKASLSSYKRSLAPNFVCSNVNSIRVDSWRDRKFNQAVAQLNPAMIRIPGGDESNYWNWRKGGTIDDLSDLPEGLPPFISSSKDRRYNSSKLEDWQAGLKNHHTPLFVLNMLSDDLESQLEMLKTARELGMSVKYIELGNEFYFPTDNYRSVFPEIEDYTAEVNRWIAAIKTEFPQAKIAVMGVAKPGDYVTGRVYQWNKKVIQTSLPQADAITIHTYPRNGLVSRDIVHEKYPYFQEEDIPYVLGEVFQNWGNVSQVISDFPDDRKIWVTEYNLLEDINAEQGEKQQRIAGSWLHGIYALSMSLLFLEDPRIEIACNHMLIGSSQFSTILANENSFIDPNNPNIKSVPLSFSATGNSLKLFANATEGMNQAQKIKFTDNPSIVGKNQFTYPTLSGWMFANNQQNKNALLLNLSAHEIETNISSLFSGEVDYETISGSPSDLVVKPGILRQTVAKTSQKILLPPYSVIKISNN